MPEMVAPRALVFRPLVKGNEALGTRLGPRVPQSPSLCPSCANEKGSGVENGIQGRSRLLFLRIFTAYANSQGVRYNWKPLFAENFSKNSTKTMGRYQRQKCN